ncbi:FMN-linked oxidoreductase [Xylariaceae sp. FL1019]|nr:FMN-linked oxidoreductase [Xylariaceae sp. FL1019]
MAPKLPPDLVIDPPLLNSANPWATTQEDLRQLYACPTTGAVTTRTALIDGFAHDDAVHRFTFFGAGQGSKVEAGEGEEEGEKNASINSLGYSPIALDGYLGFIKDIDGDDELAVGKKKTIIVSVTGTPDEVAECYCRVAKLRFGGDGTKMALAVEINLSCPNIPGKPPPAYTLEAMWDYVVAVSEIVKVVDGQLRKEKGDSGDYRIPWGLKTPPYTHDGQFALFAEMVWNLAREQGGACPLSFVTATNTLGSSVVFDEEGREDIAGGLAGAPLHPLALGNVKKIRGLLDGRKGTEHVAVIGVGGVSDAEGYKRMRAVGATAVGVGTALGIRGMSIFQDIWQGVKDSDQP